MTEGSPHHLRGAVLALNVLPGYAKNAYPGLMYSQPSGLHAGGVIGNWPRVERFVRHPGLGLNGKPHPGRGARII
jgi:hypothetical protein